MDYKQYSSANRRPTQHILATYLSFRQKDQSSQVRYTMILARNGWSKGKQEEEQRRESKQDLCCRTNTGRGYEWEWAALAPDGRAPKSRGKIRSFSKLWLWWWRLQQQIQQSIAASRESEAMWPSVYIELLMEDQAKQRTTTTRQPKMPQTMMFHLFHMKTHVTKIMIIIILCFFFSIYFFPYCLCMPFLHAKRQEPQRARTTTNLFCRVQLDKGLCPLISVWKRAKAVIWVVQLFDGVDMVECAKFLRGDCTPRYGTVESSD